MLKTFTQLLGDDAPVLRRYIGLTLLYGALCGLTISALVPTLTCLLTDNFKAATPWLALLLTGLIVCWVLRRTVEHTGVRVGVTILRGTRHRLGDQLAKLPVGWFTPQNTARLNHLITQGVMTLAQVPAHVLTPVISGVVTAVILIILLLILHWPMGLIALAALPVLTGLSLLSAKLSNHADQAFHQRFAEASQRVVEFAQAQSVLRAFNGEGGSTRFLEQIFEQQRQSGQKLIWLSAGSAVLTIGGVQLVFAALLITATLWIHTQSGYALASEEALAVTLCLLVASRFIDALLEITSYGEVLRNARGQLNAINEVLSLEPLPEPNSPQRPQDASIELRHVHFRYTADQPEVLKNVSLHLKPGSMTALIGESGSGKSTLVHLIARFFDVSQGNLLIGGVDVRQIHSAQLTHHISQIFQDTYLFTGSIGENIRIGQPDASDAEVMEAARLAGVDKMIERLEGGLMTPVGEGGARLSGGERQRIAIARALIKQAPILLVDEATAALDAENQVAITEVLARLRGQRTLVVIAHQLSTIAMADQIVVLEGGCVVEQGSPAELRQSQGRYTQFLSERQAAKGWRLTSAASDGAPS